MEKARVRYLGEVFVAFVMVVFVTGIGSFGQLIQVSRVLSRLRIFLEVEEIDRGYGFRAGVTQDKRKLRGMDLGMQTATHCAEQSGGCPRKIK